MIMKKFKKNLDNIKIFIFAFLAFLAANYFYSNIISKSTASNVEFIEVEVQINGSVDVDLKCKGSNTPNPASVNRGLGEQTESDCKGTGTFSVTVPQQRFVNSQN